MAGVPTHPKLRPVEPLPVVDERGDRALMLHDPSGLAEGSLVVSSMAALFLFQQMDGRQDLGAIEAAFARQFGQALPEGQLERMVAQLDAAYFLESEWFAAYLGSLVAAYRSAPARVSAGPESFGADGQGLETLIDGMLAPGVTASAGRSAGRLTGLIAPHLDYRRGSPCYADAYGLLAAATPPRRCVILGTNHFGRATSVVATNKDFETPLGTTRADRRFIDALNERCGRDLCEHEFDHQREHSIELQVILLQHLLGTDGFEIVPVLCHDPCGPTGTAPCDGNGVDLRAFGEALRDLLAGDDTPTLVIAGADLSHVGARFGDERELDDAFLGEVERTDRDALAAVVAHDPAAFVERLSGGGNATRVCSAGCIYALMTALPNARPELLRYHQAVDVPAGTCVTCSAVAFWNAS